MTLKELKQKINDEIKKNKQVNESDLNIEDIFINIIKTKKR
ncbi:hypothetical protein RBU49_01545 [Clostridium sp. MB40-C1]|nr:hypothetical protein [Clostridium sp. MB40-C1]WMJ80962.1 hypothetical protein RBU49_01545 [Clostridium sp. MB40-C1]